MKKYLVPFLSLLAVAACGDDDDDGGDITPDAGSPDAEVTGRHLVVFHTNDEHSHLFGFAPEIDDHPSPTAAGTGAIHGGIARRAKVLTDERAALKTANIDSVTVSAGDETQGALPQAAYTESSHDFQLMK